MATLKLSSRELLIAYGVAPLITAAASLTWYRPGEFIAGGDNAPFLRQSLATEIWSVWNHQWTGAGSASYSIAQLLDVAVVRGLGLVGLPPTVAQSVFYTLCFMLAAFGVSFFAGVWVRRPALLAFAGLAGVFNCYVLTSFPNLLPVLSIAVAGMLCGMVLRTARGASGYLVPFALASVLLSYVAQNPPLLVVVVAVVVLCAAAAPLLVGRETLRKATRFTLIAGVLSAVVNLWWVVPYGVALVGRAGLSVTAETDVLSWTMVYQRATLANTATMTGNWGWNPDYYPFFAALEEGPWSVLKWFFPLLALAGALLARRRSALLLGGVALTCAVFATGLRPPFGPVNLWLFEHVPGLWLLRDPGTKIGVLLVLCYATLSCYALEWLARIRIRARLVFPALAALVALATVVYPWPLLTGDVVPDNRTDLPGMHVRVPDDWLRLASAVDRAPGPGKVLVLPLLSYYQASTSWGYHGADSVPQLFSRAVLQQMPGGYFRARGAAEPMMDRIARLLDSGQTRGVERMLRSLGVSHVVLRRDLVSNRHVKAPEGERIGSTLEGMPGLRRTGEFDIADVYSFTTPTAPVRVYTSVAGTPSADTDEIAGVISSLAADTALTSSGAARAVVVNEAATIKADEPVIVRRVPGVLVQQRMDISSGQEGAELRVVEAQPLVVDGRPVSEAPPQVIPLDSTDVGMVDVDGQAQTVRRRTTGLTVRPGGELTVYERGGKRLLQRFSKVNDCNKYDSTSPRLSAKIDGRAVRLTASAHTACVNAQVLAPAGTELVGLRLRHRTVAGAPARLCLWQEAARSCAALPPIAGAGPTWRRYAATARLDPADGPFQLFLYADGHAGRKSVVDYRDIALSPLVPRGSAALVPAEPREVVLPAGSHRFGTAGGKDTPSLGPASPVSNCANAGGLGLPQNGIAARTTAEGGYELTAGSEVGCLSLPYTGAPTGMYRLELRYRSITGHPPRMCLWQEGPDRCADLPHLVAKPGWQEFTATVTPAVGTQALRLFLYADGPSRVAFDDLVLRPLLASPAVLLPVPPTPPPAPEVQVLESGLDHHRIRVTGASGDFALSLAESYATGWRIAALPPGWQARHVTLDGYANGWLVSGRGSAELVLEYAPSRWIMPVQATALAALAALPFIGIIIMRRRRR